jgi:hypothetical protein
MGRQFASRSARGAAVLVGALTLCVMSGCYEHALQGNASIYRFAWWLGPMLIAAGVLSVPAGWLLRQWNAKWGFVLMILGPILLVVVVPAMYSDYVVVDDEHFEARYGFWFSPTVHNVQFQELREIRYVAVPGSRGRTDYELRCLSNTGQVSVVHAGDLVKNTVPEILARARARGVSVASQVP